MSRSSETHKSQLRARRWRNGLRSFIHVPKRLICHYKYLSWRIWGQIKSFQKWKVTCNWMFPKMERFWSKFNLILHHQISFKWIFSQHESWRSLSPISKKSKIMSIWWMVKELWSNHGKVCLKLQMAISFEPKLQIWWFFLHCSSHVMRFPNQPSHCMKC